MTTTPSPSPAPRDSSARTSSRLSCSAVTPCARWSSTTRSPLRAGSTRCRPKCSSTSTSSWATSAITGRVMDLTDGVDAVCHLAALIAIPYSYQAPESYLATNAGRHAEHPRGGTHPRHAACHPHLDQRGVRHGAHGADRRDAPAAGAVAVLGVEDRRRQAGRELPPQLRRSRSSRCDRSTPTARVSRPAP